MNFDNKGNYIIVKYVKIIQIFNKNFDLKL